jgi:histidyl-tRNA synthetase
MRELAEQGVPIEATRQLADDLASGSPQERVRARLERFDLGRAGLGEIDRLETLVAPVLRSGNLRFDPFLARGLDYYTGTVFEVSAAGLSSSIASGGRYDDLIGMFSKDPVPACGGSLDLERIILLLEGTEQRQLGLPQVLVSVWDDALLLGALRLASEVREGGISAEVYPGEGDISRQLRYASKKEIPICLLFGPDEQAKGVVTLKDMRSGQQKTVACGAVVSTLGGMLAAPEGGR